MCYFTKWADAIPLPDLTAYRITAELINFFCVYGSPQILHSDQDINFESTIFLKFWMHSVFINHIPPHTTYKGMVWLNNSTEHCYSCYKHMSQHKITGKPTFHMYCMHIKHLNMLQQDFHHFYFYMVDIYSNISLLLNRDMICYPTQHNFKQSLRSFKILFTQILLRQLVHKSHIMITIPNNSHLPW